MIITYYGHSMFQMALNNGQKILIDPYDKDFGYPPAKLYPDFICVSHQHHDHNNTTDFMENSQGNTPQIFDKEGQFSIGENITVTLIPSFHDEQKGALRGENLLISIQAEGLHLVHVGDLGETLPSLTEKKLGKVDILCVPIGGYYTIDAKEGKALCKRLAPRVIIPMHYQSQYSANLPIAPLEEFLQLWKTLGEEVPLLRVTKEDLSEQPKMAILNFFHQEG